MRTSRIVALSVVGVLALSGGAIAIGTQSGDDFYHARWDHCPETTVGPGPLPTGRAPIGQSDGADLENFTSQPLADTIAELPGIGELVGGAHHVLDVNLAVDGTDVVMEAGGEIVQFDASDANAGLGQRWTQSVPDGTTTGQFLLGDSLLRLQSLASGGDQPLEVATFDRSSGLVTECADFPEDSELDSSGIFATASNGTDRAVVGYPAGHADYEFALAGLDQDGEQAWDVPLADMTTLDSLTVADDVVVVSEMEWADFPQAGLGATRPEGDASLGMAPIRAFQVDDGAPIWQWDTQAGPDSSTILGATSSGDDDILVAATQDDSVVNAPSFSDDDEAPLDLVGLSPATGEEQWRVSVPA